MEGVGEIQQSACGGNENCRTSLWELAYFGMKTVSKNKKIRIHQHQQQLHWTWKGKKTLSHTPRVVVRLQSFLGACRGGPECCKGPSAAPPVIMGSCRYPHLCQPFLSGDHFLGGGGRVCKRVASSQKVPKAKDTFGLWPFFQRTTFALHMLQNGPWDPQK